MTSGSFASMVLAWLGSRYEVRQCGDSLSRDSRCKGPLKVDRPRLTGSPAELECLADWLQAMEQLRDGLAAVPSGADGVDGGAAIATRELARNVLRAENRLRAHVGLPPLMH